MLELTGVQIAAILFAVSAPLSVVFIATIGRMNDPEDTQPVDHEPLGDMVDVRRIIDRYSED